MRYVTLLFALCSTISMVHMYNGKSSSINFERLPLNYKIWALDIIYFTLNDASYLCVLHCKLVLLLTWKSKYRFDNCDLTRETKIIFFFWVKRKIHSKTKISYAHKLCANKYQQISSYIICPSLCCNVLHDKLFCICEKIVY